MIVARLMDPASKLSTARALNAETAITWPCARSRTSFMRPLIGSSISRNASNDHWPAVTSTRGHWSSMRALTRSTIFSHFFHIYPHPVHNCIQVQLRR